MYFFYFNESDSRDLSISTAEKPKDHLYILLAVGMYESRRRPFETAISDLKIELADYLRRDGKGHFELANYEVKSNLGAHDDRAREAEPVSSRALHQDDMTRLTDTYFHQVDDRNTVIISSVIGKRYLHDHITHETLHLKAYEFLLERIRYYMREYHPKHRASIMMDDTNKQLNHVVATKHASFQRAGNRNITFPVIVEYPFFTRSELSNGVQLADLLGYNVYRAFKFEDFCYPYFERVLPNFYRRRDGEALDELKVWPEPSPLIGAAREAWRAYKQKALSAEGE